jgi:endonuclease/exonuclease/phosphatase family metal-dependent hydrolase
MSIKICQYNVLSPHYVFADIYHKCNPLDLDKSIRLERFLNKLTTKILAEFIITLQEVCKDWLNKIIELCEKYNYQIVHTSYNDLGENEIYLLILFPGAKQKRFEIIESFDNCPLRNLSNGIKLQSSWIMAKELPNKVLITKVRDTRQDIVFVLATTHFPHLTERISTIYTIQTLQCIQIYSQELPIIYTGDFNFTPNSYQYQIVTTGKVVSDHSSYPEETPFKWNTLINSMNSAYNNCRNTITHDETVITSQGHEIFIDHIFCYSCKALFMDVENNTDNLTRPNDSEPSDHLMIYAFISMSNV